VGAGKPPIGIAVASPTTTVIALSAYDDARSVLEMFEGGVREFIAKDAPTGALIDAIRRGARKPRGKVGAGRFGANAQVLLFLPLAQPT
jgi:FixJ family two-component response regulator